MSIRADEITEILKSQIKGYETRVDVAETGVLLSVGDGIARVHGLEKARGGELLEFPGEVRGIVLNLEEDNVGIALLGDDHLIKEGDVVRRTGRIVEVPVGDAMVGRVLNSLGQPIDGRGPGVICVYVAIGQKQSTVAQVVEKLRQFGAMDYTIVISATASQSAPI